MRVYFGRVIILQTRHKQQQLLYFSHKKQIIELFLAKNIQLNKRNICVNKSIFGAQYCEIIPQSVNTEYTPTFFTKFRYCELVDSCITGLHFTPRTLSKQNLKEFLVL